MNKNFRYICILISIAFISFFLISINKTKTYLRLDENNRLTILVATDSGQQEIKPWFCENENTYYFFLPAFCNEDNFYIKNNSDGTVYINGIVRKTGSSCSLSENTTHRIESISNHKETVFSYNVIVLYSENLPSLFIETAGGNMDYIHENKENRESGYINVITSNGNIEYSGALESISGRGNSTWNYDKKPYSIKLSQKKALLGMDAGKKWALLAGWREGAKLNTKIAYDIAEELELAYSPSCTWVDLYLNGEYAGIYYLSETVSVGDGRVDICDLEKENELGTPIDISGGYLIEKEFSEYWEENPTKFSTDSGAKFTLKEPQNASAEQIDYIQNYIQSIDTMISNGNIDYENSIDLDSFSKKFVLDELVFHHDTNVASMFFYKDRGNSCLYAGPVWDFDGAFGENNSEWTDGRWMDYSKSFLESLRSESELLLWNAKLYEDPTFQNAVAQNYQAILPQLDELINIKIDEYASYIQKSVHLDKIRWQSIPRSDDWPGNYQTFDNDIRFMKYFLSNRINHLANRWEVSCEEFIVTNESTTHTVTFMIEDEVVETRTVPDGAVLDEFPEFDSEHYYGWFFTYSDERYRKSMPIYEDCILYVKKY